MSKFRGKGQIPRLGSKFRGPRKTVGSNYTVSQKNRTPATFCNNSNSPGSIAIDFDKNNR